METVINGKMKLLTTIQKQLLDFVVSGLKTILEKNKDFGRTKTINEIDELVKIFGFKTEKEYYEELKLINIIISDQGVSNYKEDDWMVIGSLFSIIKGKGDTRIELATIKTEGYEDLIDFYSNALKSALASS